MDIHVKLNASWLKKINKITVRLLLDCVISRKIMFELGVESLPDDMQRNISQMRELDLHYQGMLLNKEINKVKSQRGQKVMFLCCD